MGGKSIVEAKPSISLRGFPILKHILNQCVPAPCGSEFEIVTCLIRGAGGPFSIFAWSLQSRVEPMR